MSPYLSRHVDCDDMRHFAFARRCPDFHVDRRSLGERLVWPAICLACLFLVVYIAAMRLVVIQ